MSPTDAQRKAFTSQLCPGQTRRRTGAGCPTAGEHEAKTSWIPAPERADSSSVLKLGEWGGGSGGGGGGGGGGGAGGGGVGGTNGFLYLP